MYREACVGVFENGHAVLLYCKGGSRLNGIPQITPPKARSACSTS